MPRVFDLIVGIAFLFSGIVMFWRLAGYQRRLEKGEIEREKSQPSFQTLRRAAAGFVALGLLFIVGWVFHLF